MKRTLALTASLLTALVPLIASAQDGPPKQPMPVDIAVGLKGGLGGVWTTEAPNTTVTYADGSSEQNVDPDYFPMFGLGGDVGLAVDIRFAEIVAIETGLRYSWDNASGWNDQKINGNLAGRVTQSQKTQSMRIPLWLKVTGTSGIVRPFFGLGAEFVLQQSSSIDYTLEQRGNGTWPESEVQKLRDRNRIEPSNYAGLGTTMGLEIDLGMIRIPIELRALYNVGYDEQFNERVRVEGTRQAPRFFYNGAFQGHFGFSVGILYNYELLLE